MLIRVLSPTPTPPSTSSVGGQDAATVDPRFIPSDVTLETVLTVLCEKNEIPAPFAGGRGKTKDGAVGAEDEVE